jgi:hypothetical protein
LSLLRAFLSRVHYKNPLTDVFRPWDLQGTMWYLPYSAPNNKLPLDAHSLEERGTPYADELKNGRFVGSFGGVLIVRYTQTDVGVYETSIAFQEGR